MKKKNDKKKGGKKIRNLIIVAAIVVAAIVVVRFIGTRFMAEQTAVQNVVEMQEVQERDLSQFVTLQGTVLNENKVNYSSIAAAEVTAVNVQVGDEVKAGDVLIEMDPDTIQEQIDSAQSSLANSQGMQAVSNEANQHALNTAVNDQSTQLSQASQAITNAQNACTEIQTQIDDANAELLAQQQALEKAEALKSTETIENELRELTGGYTETYPLASDTPEILAKKTELSERQAMSESINTLQNVTIPALETDLETAQGSVDEANAAYTSTQTATNESIYAAQSSINASAYSGDDSALTSQISDLNKQLEACTVTAVADGIVTAVNVSVGDINAPNTVIVTVENDEKLIMEAPVSEKDILKLEEGMRAVITSEALDDVEIAGEVVRVVRVASTAGSAGVPDPTGQASGGEGTFSVQIALESCDLLSGMSAKAKITIEGNPEVVCVPYDLVKTDENGQNYVLIGVDNGDGTYTAQRCDITIGEEFDYYTEVKGGDLKIGDYVIMDYDMVEGDVFYADIPMEETEDTDGAAEPDALG